MVDSFCSLETAGKPLKSHDAIQGVSTSSRLALVVRRCLRDDGVSNSMTTTKTGNVYLDWVQDALARKPHLSQSGLARHIGRHRAVISKMLQGDRQIKASELQKIADYLGEPIPGLSAPVPTVAATVPVVGRVGAAWYEKGTAPAASIPDVSPVSGKPTADQVAYQVDTAMPELGVPAGAVIVAIRASGRPSHTDGAIYVIERERAGLTNITLARAAAGVEIGAIGTLLACAIELRVAL